MIVAKDFILERFVCQIFRGSARASRALIENAMNHGMTPESVICQLIWPTLECMESLRRDGVMSRKIYQRAATLLRGLSAETGLRLHRSSATGTSMLICFSEPVYNELPAQIMADIADAGGWDVTWLCSSTQRYAISESLRINHHRAVMLCVPCDADVQNTYRMIDELWAITPWARYLLFPLMPSSNTDWPRRQDTTLVHDPAELSILLSEYIGSEMLCDGPAALTGLRFRNQ